tara:strand:- start:879 stop:1556 length:678 start_codon:yes stop_codon:yes gene_type:complete
MKYKIILIVLLSFVFSKTGMVTPKGDKGFGLWGSMVNYIDQDIVSAKPFGDDQRTLTLDYYFPFGLQLSHTKVNGEDKENELSYYFKGNRSNFSFSIRQYVKERYDNDPISLTVRWFTNKGLSVGFMAYNVDATESWNTYWCDEYQGHQQGYIEVECDSWDVQWGYWDRLEPNVVPHLYTNEYITIGKFKKLGSYVLGIEYFSLMDNLDNPEDGIIQISIGTRFK